VRSCIVVLLNLAADEVNWMLWEKVTRPCFFSQKMKRAQARWCSRSCRAAAALW